MYKAYLSDIDRTLIFSTSFLKNNPYNGELVEVEKVTDTFSSYMTKDSYEALKQFADKNLFVPVTSRTVSQYNRINFGFQPQYAVTSIGGIILKDGKPLEDWKEYVSSLIDLKLLEETAKEMQNKGFQVKISDNCFLFFKTEEAGYEKFLPGGFKHIEQGKKHYFVPGHISKTAAICYLKRTLGIESTAVSGDSMLDMDMLESADLAIVPDSAYIVEDAKRKGFMITEGGAASPVNTIKCVYEFMKD